jgi:hypothetical protein
MITDNAFTLGRSLMGSILRKMIGIGKCQTKFLTEIFLLFLMIRGRINFLQLSRYDDRSEKTFRNQFEKSVDFMTLNIQLASAVSSGNRILAFDPSFISKSGKKTPGIGYFYSGQEGRSKRGLEIGGIAMVDLQHNTAYHLEAVQTPVCIDSKDESASLITHYAQLILDRMSELKQVSNILAVDGYFAKRNFLDPICAEGGLEVICKLREDANLKYLYRGNKHKGRGRPKKYAGKIDVKNPDKRKLKLKAEEEDYRLYGAMVYSVGLKRVVSLCLVEFTDSLGGVRGKNLLFSTNPERSAEDIFSFYKARFQIEFLFRDAKQFTGLENCQARSPKKLHFHFNASLTAASLARAIVRKQAKTHEEIVISVADIKTELHNELLARRIFSIYGFDPKLVKNDWRYRQILDFGKIAA